MHARSCCDLSKDELVTLTPQVNRKNHLLTSSANINEAKVMSMDRKFVKSYDNLATAYGTLPRPSLVPAPGNRHSRVVTLQAIGAVSSLFHINQEEHIIDEELRYLQAVEKGELDTVEHILMTQQREDERREKIKSGTRSDLENGHPKQSESNQILIGVEVPSPVGSNEYVNEAFELKETKNNSEPMRNLRRNPPLSNVWSTSGSSRSPLPVGLFKRGSTIMGKGLGNEKLSDKIGPKRREKFNKNCRDQWGRSALFIAMIYRNIEMMKLLLRYKVEKEECLYHAIDFGYYDIVEAFMQYDKNVKQMISGEQSYYSPGLTPFQLAAHKNDYVMLRILHEYGYGILPESQQRAFSKLSKQSSLNDPDDSVLDRAWDASNHQLLYYRAIASPSYQILTFGQGLETNTGNWDFFDNIFRLYGDLKNKVSDDPAVQSLYLPLADQLEEFACDLLNEVRSSKDLADLLRFETPGKTQSISQRHYLAPVQQAISVRMKKFVAHENCQVALSSLRLGTLFRSENGWRTYMNRTLLALLYPILCLAFSFAPNSKLGNLLRNPIVNMSCHIMSEVLFLLLMIVRLILLTHVYPCDCLGTEIYVIDYVIWLWTVARIVTLVQTFRQYPLPNLLRNVWFLNDVITSFLFISVIALKLYDVIKYESLGPYECPATMNNLSSPNIMHRCTRSEWTVTEAWPVTVSEAALAIIYFLIHIRAMEILYTDRTFGPLQLSLDKMFIDTIRFLTIFLVTFIGFGFAMTQLYWAWGKNGSFSSVNVTNPSQELPFCDDNSEFGSRCYPVYSYLLYSILEQYWTLYGYGYRREPPQATAIPQNHQGITEIAGQVVSMIFHAWAVVVMLNVLVAMLSHSFDRVRNNAELEWKFHRSKTWLKYIRKGTCPRPPPMNLVPTTRDIKWFWNLFKMRLFLCTNGKSLDPKRHLAQRDSQDTQRENLRYRQAVVNITQRYTRRYLLPDFRHNDLEQQPLACGNTNKQGVADTEATSC